MATQIPLSSVAPDVDGLTAQLQQKLAAKLVWTDIVDDATGQIVIEMIAAVGALDQHAIERMIQEISIENARMPSTIYANATTQGVRLARKTPASQEVLLTRTNTSGTLTIPAFTQFSSPAGMLFNREAIVFEDLEANPITNTLAPVTAFIAECAGGTLPNGNYSYRIAAIDSTGRAHPSEIKSINLTGTNGTVQLTWEAVGVAVKYQVFGRSNANELIADNIPPSQLFYHDDGSVTPNAAVTFPSIPLTGTVFLYEGEVKTATTTISSTADRRFFISEESNFTVSDVDVRIAVNASPIPVVTDGIWNYGDSEPAVQDRTTSKGRLNLVFGTTLYGYYPKIGDVISLVYVVTQGAAANNQEVGEAVQTTGYPDVTGVTMTPLTGGANEPSYAEYRDAPLMFARRDRCVRQQDYNVTARLYPGVADAKIFGQRDIDTTNNQYMNVFRCAILPKEGTWGTSQFKDFVTYMKSVGASGMHYIRYDPIPYDFSLEVDVYCKNNTDLVGLKQLVEQNLRNFYSRRKGILGFDSYNSDIDILIKNLSPAVDYVIIRSPKVGVITSLYSPSLTLTETVGAGTVPAGTYSYYIKAETTVGDLALKGPYLITVNANAQVNITFNQVSQIITGYTIIRDDGNSLKSLAVAPTSVLDPTADLDPITAIDTGSNFIDYGLPLPTYVNGGVWYPRLSNLEVNTYFSQR